MIGYLEPHGRVETLAQAEGLEVDPAPASAATADAMLEEMDLPGDPRARARSCA